MKDAMRMPILGGLDPGSYVIIYENNFRELHHIWQELMSKLRTYESDSVLVIGSEKVVTAR